MAKRARYDGPYPEVRVDLQNGKTVDVERGHLLPETDNDGDNIPAAIRDNLLEQADWSEVDQKPASSKKED